MKVLRIPSNDEKNPKPYIIRTIIFATYMILSALFIWFIPYYWLRCVLAILMGISFYLTLLGIISIFIVLSQKKNIKPKYHLRISKSDILMWIEKSTEPDEIQIEYNGIKRRIDIRFDYAGYSYKSNGQFVDKGIYIDNVEYGIKEAVSFLKSDIAGNVYITWYTENNNPELFKKMLDDLKSDLYDDAKN